MFESRYDAPWLIVYFHLFEPIYAGAIDENTAILQRTAFDLATSLGFVIRVYAELVGSDRNPKTFVDK